MSSTHKHFFQKLLRPSLGVVPAHELGGLTNATVDAPLVLVSLGVVRLVNEASLDAVDVENIQVRQARLNTFPSKLDLHGQETKRVNGGVNRFFEKITQRLWGCPDVCQAQIAHIRSRHCQPLLVECKVW